MSDTHDERGGDVAARVGRIADRIGGALDELRGLHGANRAKRGIAGAVADLRDIADEVRQQLAAATARAEKAEAERDELREYVTALNEAQVSLQSSSFELGWWKGFKAMPTAGVHTQAYLDTVEYADELRALNAGAAVAPDATQDGLSEPVERSETSGGAFHGNTSSITPQGLSEAEASE